MYMYIIYVFVIYFINEVARRHPQGAQGRGDETLQNTTYICLYLYVYVYVNYVFIFTIYVFN